MHIEKVFTKFINDYQKKGTYASKHELEEVVSEMKNVIIKNIDKTPEEWIDLIIKDDINYMEEMKRDYGKTLPGYTIGLKVDNINIKYFGGTLDGKERMRDDAMFDVASISKMYTQIVACNLIKENILSMDSVISDICPEFKNLNDVTVKELMNFSVNLVTDGRIDTEQNKEGALEKLHTAKLKVNEDGTKENNKYCYTDIGMMILKEIEEKVTGKDYTELVDYFIIKKLNLKDTKLLVPEKDIIRLTGSPNAKYGKVNDQKAIAMGGYSGHAGVFASSDDLISMGTSAASGIILPEEFVNDLSTPGIHKQSDKAGLGYRGVLGNTYTAHENGINAGYVDRLALKKEFNVQGSTRVQLNATKDTAATILLNPASMPLEQAKEVEKELNAKRKEWAEKNNKEYKPLPSLSKQYYYNESEDKLMEYTLIDPKQMVSSGASVEPITTRNTKTILRLQFLNAFMNQYEKHEEINITRGNSK